MKPYTLEDRIKVVARNWQQQMGPFGPGKSEQLKTYFNILAATRRTEIPAKTPAEVAVEIEEFIGNDTWTLMRCDECGTWVDWVLEVGEPSYFDWGKPYEGKNTKTAHLCRTCVDVIIRDFGPKTEKQS